MITVRLAPDRNYPGADWLATVVVDDDAHGRRVLGWRAPTPLRARLRALLALWPLIR